MKKSWLDGLRLSGAGLYFGGAAFLALLAGLSVWAILRGQAPSESIWALSRTMMPGEVVTASDLQPVTIPAGAAPTKAVRSREEAVGKRLRFGLTAGDYLREEHLIADLSDVAQRLADLGPSYRMIALPSSVVPAASRLVRGDRLEMTVALSVAEKGTSTTMAVALGQVIVVDVVMKGDEGVVLVAAEADQVQRLAVAERAGTVTYALLGHDAKALVDTRLRLDQDIVNAAAPIGEKAGG